MFRIEQLETRIQGGAAPDAAPADAPAPQAKAAPAAPAPRASAPTAPAAAHRASAAAAATAAAPSPDPAPAVEIDLERIVHLWPAVLEATGEDPMLGAALAETHPIALENGRLAIGFPPDTDFIRKKAEGKRDVIQRAIHGLTGATLAIALETSEHAKAPEQRTLTTDELIESVKRDFGAVEVDPSQNEQVEN
jgi:hypothetical protein